MDHTLAIPLEITAVVESLRSSDSQEVARPPEENENHPDKYLRFCRTLDHGFGVS